MRIESKTLAQMRREIKDAIIQKLNDARVPGGPLEDVESVVYGDRANLQDLNHYMIWVIPVAHVPVHRGGHTAQHDFTFGFVAMVKNIEDAQAGKDEAEDLAARVYDLIASDRTLGGVVGDVLANRFDPSYQAAANNSVFWGYTEFAFRTMRRE